MGGREGVVQTFYPLQKPLRPAAQAVDSDPHLGERSDVQNLHEEGVVLLPLKSGGGENGHEEGKLAAWRVLLMPETRFRGRRKQAFTQPLSQLPVTLY